MTNPLRLLALAAALAASAPAQGIDGPPAAPDAAQQGPVAWLRTEPWPAEVVEKMASLPVQWDGRIVPLSTLASVSLYGIHGRRDLKLTKEQAATLFKMAEPQEVTLSPTEWLLDVWCHPEQANAYPLFRIENAQVYGELGMDRDSALRMKLEFLSFEELTEPADGKRSFAEVLEEQAGKYVHKDAKERTALEAQVVDLDGRLRTYWSLLQVTQQLLRPKIMLQGKRVQEVFGGRQQVTWSELLAGAAQLGRLVLEQPQPPSAGKDNLVDLLSNLKQLTENGDNGLGLLPPMVSVKESDRWLHPADLAGPALRSAVAPAHLKMTAALEQALQARDLPAQCAALLAYRGEVAAQAQQRGELSGPELEAKYNRWNLSYQALHWFLFAFLVVAVSWFAVRLRILWWLGMALSTFSLGLLIADIGLRCAIRGRPPITNLFDTILWITAVATLAALVIEAINRRRIGLSLAPFFGALGIMLARVFEVMEGKDTMHELVAVLDSNFWLATHVTCINTGYAAGVLAAGIGSVWILLRLIGVRRNDQAFYSGIYRMTYGATCFGLLFAVVGTILGGIWANESWGRFWGWDPKENGALLICLCQIGLLHARMSGLVKQLGFCIAAAATGMVVVFSWFHVNQLGVGLHSYGFSGKLMSAILIYYSIQGLFVVAGAVVWFRETFQRKPETSASTKAGLPAGMPADVPAK